MGKRILIYAGIVSSLQAVAQIVFSALSIAQYLGFVDFLRELPNLIFIRILYFHNPDRTSNVITIGHAIDGIANQAFVLITREPFTATRTFIISCTIMALGFVWAITSSILLAGGALNDFSRPIRWPWVTVSVAVCAVDLVAIVIFANDSFHTRTLSDIMKYIDGTASGVGGLTIDTSAASWIMVLLYSRFVVLFIQNVVIIVLVALNKDKSKKFNLSFVENPDFPVSVVPARPPQSSVTFDQVIDNTVYENSNSLVLQDNMPSTSGILKNKQGAVDKDGIFSDLLDSKGSSHHGDSNVKNFDNYINSNNLEIKTYWYNIPRVYLNRKYRRFKETKIIIVPEENHVPKSDRSLKLDRNIARLINNINRDTAQDIKVTSSVSNADLVRTHVWSSLHIGWLILSAILKRRRNTVGELFGQLPWSYTPGPQYLLNCEKSSDEELPPIPLPDYTAKGDHFYPKSPRIFKKFDVLY